MTWADEAMYAFDLETTGIDVETARIVTATIVKVERGAEPVAREWLVNPGIEIPQGAIDVHGVTNEKAQADGIDPATAAAQILAELDEAWTGGRPVVIYNAVFDLTLLDRELRRHCGVNLDSVIGYVVDPMVCDRALDKYRRGSRKLVDVCAHYEVRLEGAHSSTGDALGAARLAWRLAQKYPILGDLATVNEIQAKWYAEWSEGFENHLARQGKPETISREWPLRLAS